MLPDRDADRARVASMIVMSLEQAVLTYHLDPAMLAWLEARLAEKPQRQLADGRIGYFNRDIEDVLLAERVSSGNGEL